MRQLDREATLMQDDGSLYEAVDEATSDYNRQLAEQKQVSEKMIKEEKTTAEEKVSVNRIICTQ